MAKNAPMTAPAYSNPSSRRNTFRHANGSGSKNEVFSVIPPRHSKPVSMARARPGPNCPESLRCSTLLRLVTQDEVLEELWPEIHVNPEVFRKYILDIRKILGDRPDKPEFIETVTKRGYRFIAPVIDEAPLPQEGVAAGAGSSEQKKSSRTHYLLKFAIIPILTVVAVAATADHFWFARSRATRSLLNANSIAVLPFVDMSPAKDQEYFSDGVAEQLIHELAKVSGLKVVGRSSAFQFRGKNEDLREVGRKLGVANILEGSVRREGNHVRITADLIKADDGFQLWSQTYDREIKDIFAVQDEIARSATGALQIKRQPGRCGPTC
jgi:TolB-like protein